MAYRAETAKIGQPRFAVLANRLCSVNLVQLFAEDCLDVLHRLLIVDFLQLWNQTVLNVIKFVELVLVTVHAFDDPRLELLQRQHALPCLPPNCLIHLGDEKPELVQ